MKTNKIKNFFEATIWKKLKEKSKNTIKIHFEQLKLKNPDLCGFAIMPGEPYEVVSPFCISCNKSEFEDEFDYSPNEWENYHAPLKDLDSLIENLNSKFKSIHQSNKNDFSLDDTEIAFIEKYHTTLLEALYELKKEKIFQNKEEDVFVLIWFSDNDIDGIISKSVSLLNSEEKFISFKAELY